MATPAKTHKIWVQLLATIAMALLVVWTGVIIWQGYVYRQAALDQARDFSNSMHSATMAGLTGMMVTGTVAQRDVYLDQIKHLGSIRDVRVLRAEAVSKIFGPGTAKDDSNPDSVEQRVLQSGQEIIQVESDGRSEYLRAVRPTLASKNYLGKDCTLCHQVPEGTVLGVVSMKVSLDQLNQGMAQQRWKSILAALITCIPVLLLIYPFIRRVVTQPLLSGVQVARNIAAGDLTQPVAHDSRTEIGELQHALGEMQDNLVRIVSQVRTATDTIYGAAADIARGNVDISQRAELQANALERTATSLATLTDTVNRNADSARKADQRAHDASKVAARAGEAVAQVVQTMESIDASARKIADITGVIDGIAFQTNILALNAAVEAARAGEQGRGFAVVASEVRSLAQRSAEAASQIKTLIQDSVQRVQAGSTQVHAAGTTMTDVVRSIQDVTGIVGSIANASAEQSAGIAGVNDAVTDMNQTLHQNAALVEEAAAAAQALKEQAGELEHLVRAFTLSTDPDAKVNRPQGASSKRTQLQLS